MAWSRQLDILALAGVSACLCVAFGYQLVLGELPCAFCNLQRLGFLIFGAGLFLNLRHGTNAWNHVLSAFGALAGSLTALLQMFVHAPAGTRPTGSAFLGFHMYAWAYVALTCAIFYALLSLAFIAAARWQRTTSDRGVWRAGSAVVSAVFLILVAGNLTSTFLQNGFGPFLGGGQQHYRMLYDGDVMAKPCTASDHPELFQRHVRD